MPQDPVTSNTLLALAGVMFCFIVPALILNSIVNRHARRQRAAMGVSGFGDVIALANLFSGCLVGSVLFLALGGAAIWATHIVVWSVR